MVRIDDTEIISAMASAYDSRSNSYTAATNEIVRIEDEVTESASRAERSYITEEIRNYAAIVRSSIIRKDNIHAESREPSSSVSSESNDRYIARTREESSDPPSAIHRSSRRISNRSNRISKCSR